MKATGQIKSTGGMIFERSTDIHRITRIIVVTGTQFVCLGNKQH
jgi:hypothetical protein